ncbi:MAG: serine--tRNA ligase [bacterium]|nr:serine--tRNA ligase [bacterium]
MLDIKFIKDNKDIVLKAIKDKNGGPVDLGRVITLSDERKVLRQELDNLNRRKNEAAAARDIEAGKTLKSDLQMAEEKIKAADQELLELMNLIPNVPSLDTPIAPDSSGNKVLREVGEKPQFDFEPKDHIELGTALGLIDNEQAAVVTGARFTYLKGGAAMLQFALLDLAIKTVTNAETIKKIIADTQLDIEPKPFIPIIPPVMIRPAVLNRMARLEPREDRYYLEKDDLFLVGSAEHTLGPMHMDEVIEEAKLPLRYVGYSTAFRREAGSYGKDTKGILRMHQFDKMELESFCLPENSYQEQELMVAVQEYLLQQLKLPYRVVLISTGDMGFPDHRQIDIETWLPGQNTYRETHSADLIGGFQPRRLNTRVKRASGELEPVHMNDATVFAIGRMLIAIMENYQTAAGSITVPAVLRSYLGQDQITYQP